MSGTTATVVTTPFPMHGYEADALGGDVVFSRLNVFTEALRQGKRPSPPERALTGPPSLYRRCGRHFYVKTLQTAAIDWYLLSKFQPILGTTDTPAPDCDESEYLKAVYEVSISFLLAYLRAQAKGELSRPIVLHGRSQAGGTIDLRSGRWIIQSSGRLNRLTAGFGSESIGNISILGATEAAQARAFLEDVYRLVDAGDLQSATDTVFDRIDRLLCDGSFDFCDMILRQVDVMRLPTALMRSFLTITAAAKAHLPSRQPLFVRIQQEMTRQKGPEMTQRLIGRLA